MSGPAPSGNALRQHGLPVARGQVRSCSSYSEQAGREAAERLIASTTGFTAILAGNDLIALGVLAALTEVGLDCPRDVSVVGFNDLPLVDKLTPALTTVALPLHEMGALAARILLDAIDGSTPTHAVAQSLLGVRLAVRGSTGPAPS